MTMDSVDNKKIKNIRKLNQKNIEMKQMNF